MNDGAGVLPGAPADTVAPRVAGGAGSGAEIGLLPTRGTAVWRGLTRRCVRCGSGKMFHHYFTMVPDCPRCGLHFERESGYWTGALALNFGFSLGIFVVLFVALVAATIPNIPVLPLILVLVPAMIIAPVGFYPFSKTLWLAIDCAFLQRLDDHMDLDRRA